MSDDSRSVRVLEARIRSWHRDRKGKMLDGIFIKEADL